MISGTPDETVWPGISQLPDYKSTFPKWPTQSISNNVPHLTEDGLDILEVRYCIFSINKKATIVLKKVTNTVELAQNCHFGKDDTKLCNLCLISMFYLNNKISLN